MTFFLLISFTNNLRHLLPILFSPPSPSLCFSFSSLSGHCLMDLYSLRYISIYHSNTIHSHPLSSHPLTSPYPSPLPLTHLISPHHPLPSLSLLSGHCVMALYSKRITSRMACLDHGNSSRRTKRCLESLSSFPRIPLSRLGTEMVGLYRHDQKMEKMGSIYEI